MYRVSIHNDKYRAVLVGSHESCNTIFEHEDWRVFSTKLKQAIEHEATLSRQNTVIGPTGYLEYKSSRSEPEIHGICERRSD